MGRPIPTKTKLGKMMVEKGVKAYELSGAARIANRTLTEILAGRRAIRSDELVKFCRLLRCRPEDIDGLVEDKGSGQVGAEKEEVGVN